MEVLASNFFQITKYRAENLENKYLTFNPLSDGIQIMPLLMGGGALNTPPLKTLKMKLQSDLRGQNRGSWVCPVHVDYFQ